MQATKATINAVHKFMVAFYKWLVRNNYTENLLAAVVIAEKKENKRTEDDEIIVWEDYEVETIAENPGDHRLRFFVLLCLTTGLRISELIGLKYSDFSEDMLHVDRSYTAMVRFVRLRTNLTAICQCTIWQRENSKDTKHGTRKKW